MAGERWVGLFTALLFSAQLAVAEPETAPSADKVRAKDDEIAELKHTVGVLVDEVASLKSQMGVPEKAELKSVYGMGPAASKVYGAGQGISLGGYAEAVYRNRVGDADGNGQDTSDFVRMVLYVGHKFSDRLLFNTELEFEHASTGENGEVSVEFASLEYLIMDEVNLRGGLLLLPMGLVNEVHEPLFYYGTERPEVERRIIPSTWRENGAGVFGNVGEYISYRAYVVNSFDAMGFTSAGLRDGRQDGSQAISEDLAFVGRLDLHPLENLMVGGSFYQGNSGQDRASGTMKLPSARARIWELHGDYECGPFHTRALFAQSSLGDAGKLSTVLGLDPDEPVAEEMLGGYVESGYDLFSFLRPGSEQSLVAFLRYEYVDTQHEIPLGFTRDRGQPRRLLIPGLHYQPHPNVVLKVDYRNIDTWGSNTADEVSLGFGLIF